MSLALGRVWVFGGDYGAVVGDFGVGTVVAVGDFLVVDPVPVVVADVGLHLHLDSRTKVGIRSN